MIDFYWIWIVLIGCVIWPVEREPQEPSIYDLPAVVVVYDPTLGDGNCDDNCKTVATGPLEDWMYEAAGACDAELLGSTVHFPALDLSMECVDRGTAVRVIYSEHFERDVLYFDALWHLEKVDGVILGAPEWTGWLIKDWYVTWE